LDSEGNSKVSWAHWYNNKPPTAQEIEIAQLRAEVDRLRAAIKGAEIAITRDEDTAAAARILIEAREVGGNRPGDPEALPDGTLSKSTMRRRAAIAKTEVK
jgi:hypothetical protein